MKKTKLQISAFFAEKAKISKSTADMITDVLYDKELDLTVLDRVMYRIHDFVRKEKMAAVFDSLKKKEIEAIVDEMVAEDLAWKTQKSPTSALSRNFTAWGFSEFKEETRTLKNGDIIDIQIMRTGKWKHPAYGDFEITEKTLKEVLQNFKENKR